MIEQFIIRKSSRVSGEPVRVIDAYTGPSCKDADVPPGKVYLSREDAEADARKLTQCNPVGFVVLQVGTRS